MFPNLVERVMHCTCVHSVVRNGSGDIDRQTDREEIRQIEIDRDR